jgi:hypothetical protein
MKYLVKHMRSKRNTKGMQTFIFCASSKRELNDYLSINQFKAVNKAIFESMRVVHANETIFIEPI